jgi:hypothetical protein
VYTRSIERKLAAVHRIEEVSKLAELIDLDLLSVDPPSEEFVQPTCTFTGPLLYFHTWYDVELRVT